MAVNDAFATSSTGVSDATDVVVDGNSSDTGAVQVTELMGSAAAEIYREHDPNGDGTFEYRTQIDSFTGTWHSQENELLVATNQDVRLVIRNVSGGAGDFAAVGYEVDN